MDDKDMLIILAYPLLLNLNYRNDIHIQPIITSCNDYPMNYRYQKNNLDYLIR